MNSNELIRLIGDFQNLSNQVVNLSNQTTSTVVKGYWGLSIAGLSMFISVVALMWNKKSNKAQLLHQVKNSIDTAKTQVENISMQMSELAAKKKRSADEQRQLDTMLKIQDSAFEKVLNAYEDGCQKYKGNLILRKEFKKSYFEDIREYVHRFQNKFSGPLTSYQYMLDLYNEWHKVKK